MLANPTCLITGATRGIGLAIAIRLAQRGFDLVTCARTIEGVEAFQREMEKFDVRALALVGDVRDDDFLKKLVAETISTFGKIDVLINNAGGGTSDTIEKARISDWDFMLDTNLRAPMVLSKLCLEEILKSSRSAIINVASISGKSGYARASAYCASKFGLIGFSESLFDEVKDFGVKVCAICPGYVDTTLIPSGKAIHHDKMILPDDVARAVEFVLDVSPNACPTEIILTNQKNPFGK